MSSPPPQIIDPNEPLQDPGNFLENFRWDFSNIPGEELYLGENVTQASPMVRELYQAAQSCAELFVDFVSHLSHTNFAEFWFACKYRVNIRRPPRHPATPFYTKKTATPISTLRELLTILLGSRIGFAALSNFLMVLLVQAPSTENAVRAKQTLDRWRRNIRTKSQAFPVLSLARVRLDSYYWAGLSETFYLPSHVQEVILQPQETEC